MLKTAEKKIVPQNAPLRFRRPPGRFSGSGFAQVRKRVSKPSEYAKQLQEKQKAREFYGLRERQFRNYFKKASQSLGSTGEKMLEFLERRLDNVIYRLGFAPSHRAARQLVSHRHVRVNDKIVDLPSYLVRAGDRASVTLKNIQIGDTEVPLWLERDKKALSGKVKKIPERADIVVDLDEQLIIEFYSR